MIIIIMYQLGNIYLYRHYKKDKDNTLRYTLIPMRDDKKNYCRHHTVIIMMGIMDI